MKKIIMHGSTDTKLSAQDRQAIINAWMFQQRYSAYVKKEREKKNEDQ